jgi:putative transposase
MRTYQRLRTAGGRYFFTVNLAHRRDNDLLLRHIEGLREAFRVTKRDHPFALEAIVVLPDHVHALWQLPEGDDDFSTRWQLIKARFSRGLEPGERVTASRRRKGERGIWQRRYWEHLIRDEQDFQSHLDYIHHNPVKHGLVAAARDWPYSSFRRWVACGAYSLEWDAPAAIDLSLDD